MYALYRRTRSRIPQAWAHIAKFLIENSGRPMDIMDNFAFVAADGHRALAMAFGHGKLRGRRG